ncbi:MAG: hypothetical protein IJC81_04410 [Clostridia bacterium]|nr:hypothetical protein [Clostridia bacterium]
MKKLLSLLLVFALAASFVSCGGNAENASSSVATGNSLEDRVAELERKFEELEKEYYFGMGTVANDNTVTAAAVIVDEDGIVADCKVDAVEIPRKNLPVLSDFIVPRLITKERFETEILGKLDREDSYQSWAYTKLYAFYCLYDPNDTTKAVNVIKAMQEEYPITKDGTAVYALTDISTRELVELQGYIQEFIPEYTYADMEYDHKLSGYESDVPKVESKKAIDDEWCELAEEFEKECVGKTLDEIEKLDKKYSDFVLALETAIDNADKADVSKEDEIGIGITPKFHLETMPVDDEHFYDFLRIYVLNIGIVAVAKTDDEVSAIASDMLVVEDYAIEKEISEYNYDYVLNVDLSEYKTVSETNDNEELIGMLEDLNDECEGEDIEDIEEYCGRFEPYLEQALLKAVK